MMNRNFGIEKVARAIEADMGENLPDIRAALAEVKSGVKGRVTTPEQILLRQARQRTGLTQAAFAQLIATPLATLRDWEQGRFAPPGAVACLLRLLVSRPELQAELAQPGV
jgi:putative transcriptional regulator